jgi:hypothetical protein
MAKIYIFSTYEDLEKERQVAAKNTWQKTGKNLLKI